MPITSADIKANLKKRKISGFTNIPDIGKNLIQNLGTGAARTLGVVEPLFGLTPLADIEKGIKKGINVIAGSQITDPEDTFVPTGEEIQNMAASIGLAFPFGEEPDTIKDRVIQNVGSSIPVAAALPLRAGALAIEGIGAVGAAVGGKVAQESDFGTRNPEIARGIGELLGGIGSQGTAGIVIRLARFVASGGTIGAAFRFIKQVLGKSEKRATKKIDTLFEDAEGALQELEKTRGLPGGDLASTAEATGIRGSAELQKAVEEEVPKVAALLEKNRIKQIEVLKKEFNSVANATTDTVDNARRLLEEQISLRVSQAELTLMKVTTSADPSSLSTKSTKIFQKALKEQNDIIDGLWKKLRSEFETPASNLKTAITEEFLDIQEKGVIDEIDIKRIPFLARVKLGTLNKKGNLTGGSFFKKPKKPKSKILDAQGNLAQEEITEDIFPSAKAVHRLYSDLGAEIERLGRVGGKGNSIRIINKLRNAALKDLDEVPGDATYRETIKLTKEFHDIFTGKTAVARILGRARGETPASVLALEDILGEGGVDAKQNILQALEASPQVRQEIKEFIKFKFALATVNRENNKINVSAGNMFIKKFNEKSGILDDIFPELKRDIENAISKQLDVDEFLGVKRISQLSPSVKEEGAVNFFLGRKPGTEMAALLNDRSIKGGIFLKELVKLTREDPTGKALRGLQNAFTDELLKFGNIADEIPSGTKMLNKLTEVRKTVLNSGLLERSEFERLEVVANRFKRIESVAGAKKLKGGVLNDVLSFVIETAAAFTGATIGGEAGTSIGAGFVLAGRGSRKLINIFENITNDEAKLLLIAFVTDKELAKDLLIKTAKLSESQSGNLAFRLAKKLEALKVKAVKTVKQNIQRPTATTLAPAAGSFAAEDSDPLKDEADAARERLRTVLQ